MVSWNPSRFSLAIRLFPSDPNCDRRSCVVPNCGKDFVAAALPGECCEKCVPWEYASSLGIQYPQAPPQPVYDPRNQPSSQYNQYQYNQPQPPPPPQYQPQRVDVYIFGPDEGARVSTGQSIYFDCEVVSPYNQYAQPRWSRSGNQVSRNLPLSLCYSMFIDESLLSFILASTVQGTEHFSGWKS